MNTIVVVVLDMKIESTITRQVLWSRGSQRSLKKTNWIFIKQFCPVSEDLSRKQNLANNFANSIQRISQEKPDSSNQIWN
jgi:hypothetical protein